MATLNNGANGGFSGKVGSIIGYQRFGKSIIRGIPKISVKNKKGSASQKACRSGFTKMQYFLSPLVPFIRVGFNLEAKKRQMTAHNVAKSHNMLNAQNPNGAIDFSKVLLTYGNLLGVENPMVGKDDTGLRFSWTNNTGEDWTRRTDQVMVVAYNVNLSRVYAHLSGARREAMRETLMIAEREQGNEFQVWISFIADDRESIAMSTYLGSIIF